MPSNNIDLLAQMPATPPTEQLRPHTRGEVVGQRHLVGTGKPLRVAVESGKLLSMRRWRPPGVGKTTLARILTQGFHAPFLPVSAVFCSVKGIREAIDKARLALQHGQETILFVDEAHCFNKFIKLYINQIFTNAIVQITVLLHYSMEVKHG